MPLSPNLLERLVLLRLNRGPAPVLDLFGAASFETVTLAVDLGIFEALDEEPRPPDALAGALDCHSDGVRALLGFLEAEGYVTQDGGRYQNTAMTTTWLLADSRTNMAPWFVFWRDVVFPFWREHLETAIREGEPPQTLYEWLGDDEDGWEVTQRGFRAAASILVEEVANRLTVSDGSTRVLDIGGGHGLYAIELCRRHPDLTATVFDFPAALDVAREEAAEAEVDDRIEFRGGDYTHDDLGEGYDLALVFNVVHAHDAAENAALFEHVADTLAPGGRVAVLDQFEGSALTPVGRAGLSFVGLTYLATLGARIYEKETVTEWLTSAGFEGVRSRSIRRAGPGNTLLRGHLPGAKTDENVS